MKETIVPGARVNYAKPIVSGQYRTFRELAEGESYIEFEGSTITIPIRGRTPGGKWKEERLKLGAFMRLEVYPAYTNGLGTREFQFTIRDWELYGYSALLNEIFMGDERGYRCPGRRSREQAVMTFSVAHHYEKHGDDDNASLGPVTQLEIRDLTSHDMDEGDIYWRVVPSDRKKSASSFDVIFHRKSRAEDGSVSRVDLEEDYDDVIAFATDVSASASFAAVRPRDSTNIRHLGNTLISSRMKPWRSVNFKWCLGAKPREASGRIHVVSPAKSMCVADQGPMPGHEHDSADFPARITYAASYDIFVNNLRFVADQAGVAIATGVDNIPPRDVKVAFQKPHSGKVLGQHLSFAAGTCTGMVDISLQDFYHGCDMARYFRSSRLDTQSGTPPTMDPPSRLGEDV